MSGPRHGSVGAEAEAVRIWLLGGFKVSVGSRSIEKSAWRLRKASALVKLLALAPGHRLHHEQVMDLFWPDLGKKSASNNLRQTLYAARGFLDLRAGARYLASEDEALVLCPGGSLWVDVEVFEETALTSRRSGDPAAYRAAIELYAGDLLPEDRYEEWVEGRRENLRQLYLAEQPAAHKATVAEEPSPYSPSVALTPREKEVALLVAQELSNRQIASALTLSEHTVATHIRNVLKKLGLVSRNQVAVWVREHQPPS